MDVTSAGQVANQTVGFCTSNLGYSQIAKRSFFTNCRFPHSGTREITKVTRLLRTGRFLQIDAETLPFSERHDFSGRNGCVIKGWFNGKFEKT